MYDVLKAAAGRHADHESRHAPDIADDALWQFVEEASAVWQPILWILYITGIRAKAAAFLRLSRLFIPTDWDSENIDRDHGEDRQDTQEICIAGDTLTPSYLGMDQAPAI